MGLWTRARILVVVLLISHFIIRLAFPFPEFFVDVILYNSISISSALLVLFAPKYCDKTSKVSLAIGIATWSLGSTLSTWLEFSYLPHFTLTITSSLYLIFYPSVLIGLIRFIQKSTKFEFIGALDSSILTLGLISLGATFLIKPVLPMFNGDFSKNFFGLFFPVADLILLSLALTLFLNQPLSSRNSFLLLGASIFSLSDFLFLWLSLKEHYSLGRLSDDLWLLGIVLLSEAYWRHGSSSTPAHSLHPLFITSSVMVAATLIGILLLRPGYLPAFILFPSILTCTLALLRMAIALRDTRSIDEERFMARADELTGLPNRRRFIAELNL